MSTRPGVLNPATSNSPLGSICASEGYAVGVRTDVDEVAVPVEAVYPTADLRDQDAAVGEGVAPFGELNESGGWW